MYEKDSNRIRDCGGMMRTKMTKVQVIVAVGMGKVI